MVNVIKAAPHIELDVKEGFNNYLGNIVMDKYPLQEMNVSLIH